MQIENVSDGYSNKMIVTGLIKTVDDSNQFREELHKLISKESKPITIHIKDSFIVTSSIIGHLLKAVNVDKARITLYVGQSDLFQLLEQLNLITPLNVKKVS